MTEELEVLKIVTGGLSNANIPYMVTGSMAMNFYAMPRMTRDIDIVVELSSPDIGRLIQRFQSDFYIDYEMIQQALEQKSMFNMIHTNSVTKVDCIIRKESNFQHEAFSRRQVAVVEEHPFTIITPEDLILSKLLWAKDTRSEIQLRDIRNLLTTADGLNLDYLQQWITKLGVGELYGEANR